MIKHEVNGGYINILVDAEFFWAHVQTPTKKYKSDDQEYNVEAFLSYEDAGELARLNVNKCLYKVGVDKKKKGKGKGQVKFPSDTYPEGKVGFSVSSPATKRDGSPAPRPNVLVLKDGKRAPFGGLVGNGSKGKVFMFGYQNEDEEWNLRLKGVLIEELVEYGEVSELDKEFTGEDPPPVPAKKEPVSVKKSPVPAKKEPFDESFDDDIPF